MKYIIAIVAGILISFLITWLLSKIAFRCATKKWLGFKMKSKAQNKEYIKRLAHLRGWDLENLVVTKRKPGAGPELM